MQRCRNYLPAGPFDQIGPRMRPGLAQTDFMFGGFVIRNNPIGALFDQIRAFCSPLPQEEQGEEGGYIAAEPYLSTPEFTDFGQAPAGGYAGYLVGGPPSSSLTPTASPCGPGTIWDAGLGQCVLPPAEEAPASRETPRQRQQRQLRERGRKQPFGPQRRKGSGKASVNV